MLCWQRGALTTVGSCCTEMTHNLETCDKLDEEQQGQVDFSVSIF